MKNILKAIFPHLITLLLWSLPNPAVNPFGALALIPIFYYGFADPRKYWTMFGLLFSFLLDFSADSLFLFSSIYLLAIAANGAWGLFNEATGFRGFAMYSAAASFALFVAGAFSGWFWLSALGAIWLEALLLVFYVPLSLMFGRFK